MVITLSVLYYFYLLVVLFFILGGLANIYHLIRFGFSSVTNILIIIIFIVIGTVALMYSMELMQQIDWTLPILNLKNQNLVNQDIFY